MGQSVTKIKRLEGWPLLLSRFLSDRENMSFQWGVNDCLLFAADCVFALTNVDYGAPWRGQYNTEEQAKEILDRDFGGSITNVINIALGEALPYPLKGKRGDIVVGEISGKSYTGVIDDSGRRVAFLAVDRAGLFRMPLKETMMVWGYG